MASIVNVGSIDRIIAEHVLEHLTLREVNAALGHIYRYLKPSESLRVAVPDAFHPSKYYYNLVKPGGWETPYDHMLIFDYEMLSRIAREIGFEIILLEYFDESRMFHSAAFKQEDGAVRRCAANNVGLDKSNERIMQQFFASIPGHLRQQFADRRMTYTSLIADLVKPG